jgi:hypothetical protein
MLKVRQVEHKAVASMIEREFYTREKLTKSPHLILLGIFQVGWLNQDPVNGETVGCNVIVSKTLKDCSA